MEHQPARSVEPAETPGPMRVWAQPLGTLIVWGTILALGLIFFVQLRAIFLGLIAANAIAALLRPVVTRLPGPRTLRGAAVGVGFMLLVIGVVATLVWALAGRVRQEFAKIPRVIESVDRSLANLSFRLGLEEAWTLEQLATEALGLLSGTAGAELLARTTEIAVALVIALAFIFMGSLYLLIEPRGYLSAPAVSILPERWRPGARRYLVQLEPRLRWWVIGTFTSMTIVGTLAAVGFTLIGLEFAIPLALLMGLGELVPVLGPLSAFLVALLFASGQGTTETIGVVVVYAIVQLMEGYVVLPLVMRRAVRIPPVVTLFTVVLWGRVFGAAGFLLAIPLNLVVWGLVEQFLLPAQPSEPEEESSG